jgi:60 kDa SS-A/Ro ribonucleoprotein
MVNKSLFSNRQTASPKADAVNEAGGIAYRLDPKQALAHVAATGCFGDAYYSSGQAQLDEVLALIEWIDDNQYLAKVALYARQKAQMKDMPAALLVALSGRDPVLTHRIFDRIVDNGRILRSVFQMIRSGKFTSASGKARKGLSASLQRAFQRWLNTASVGKLLSASIGNDPSLKDILRMARPTPTDNARRAMYGWLTDKEVEKWTPATQADLPAEVQLLEAYRNASDEKAQVAILEKLDSVRWDLLVDAVKGSRVWSVLARKMGPQALRMNLNTLLRHDVFSKDKGMIDYVANKIADEAEVKRSRQFPYQYFTAYLNADEGVPQTIKTALHKAAEVACGNVPKFNAPVLIGLDTSGSMGSAVTGNRGQDATSKMRCVDVAALIAAAILRSNPESVVVPFDTQFYDASIDPNDSILSIAERLARYGGGGTDCSLPLVAAVEKYSKKTFAAAIIVSDNESWVGSGRNGTTAVMTAWDNFRANQRKLVGKKADPKLVCIDLQPYQTVQACERREIMNIAGFSDSVFNVISGFIENDNARFVAEIEAIEL